MNNRTEFRVCPDGTVYSEDEYDSMSEDHSADYETVSLPEALINHLTGE